MGEQTKARREELRAEVKIKMKPGDRIDSRQWRKDHGNWNGTAHTLQGLKREKYLVRPEETPPGIYERAPVPKTVGEINVATPKKDTQKLRLIKHLNSLGKNSTTTYVAAGACGGNVNSIRTSLSAFVRHGFLRSERIPVKSAKGVTRVRYYLVLEIPLNFSTYMAKKDGLPAVEPIPVGPPKLADLAKSLTKPGLEPNPEPYENYLTSHINKEIPKYTVLSLDVIVYHTGPFNSTFFESLIDGTVAITDIAPKSREPLSKEKCDVTIKTTNNGEGPVILPQLKDSFRRNRV